MIEPVNTSNDEMDNKAFQAVCRAARAEVLRQARLGHSVPAWKDGRVVWITPEEILARDEDQSHHEVHSHGS